MTETVIKAIEAVKENQYSFCKFLSANDAGDTGSHQSGLYIPKNSHKLLFDEAGSRGQRLERIVTIKWHDGTESHSRFIYYGQQTRNEYRITRLDRKFSMDDLLILVKADDDYYLGFVISKEEEKHYFLEEFDLNREDTNAIIDKEKNTSELSFRPRAHILILLGEELIKSPVMAIYELIKNSYDADARSVEVQFVNVQNPEFASITIKDNGSGITEEVLKNVWFEPGTDFRKPLNNKGERTIKRSPIFGRIPMGEKGVGRFAVHKLGNKIKLVTRPRIVITDANGNYLEEQLLDYELAVDIDWKKFSQSKYLEDVSIKWHRKEDPSSFRFRNSSGTFIQIEDLKEEWTRGMARQLKRNTISMLSPKNDPTKFRIDLDFRNNWLSDIPNTEQILEYAPYKLSALINEDFDLTFEYSFQLLNNPETGTREIKYGGDIPVNIRGDLRPYFRSMLVKKQYDQEAIENMLEVIETSKIPYGSIMLELYSFDLDSLSLRDTTHSPSLVKDLLREHAGIKVFKGDLRVFDYGDPGNDWLGLDLKRVQNRDWFSNNQNIGYVHLDPSASGVLIEKTNREGFLENEAFSHFITLLEYLLTQFAAERNRDRKRWLKRNKSPNQSSFFSQISGFKELVYSPDIPEEEKKIKLVEEAEKIQEKYEEDRNTLLIPAGVGMTASVAIHEIEKLVPRLEESVNEEPLQPVKLRGQVSELRDYTEGILSVLRKAGSKPVVLKDTIKQAISNHSSRLKYRQIHIEESYDENAEVITCDKRLLITALMNLIDNSVYWLDTVYRDKKEIFIGTRKKEKSISILIADNGPGFKDEIDDLIRPFFTRKEGGIGIGLFIIDTIMMQYGKLDFIFDRQYMSDQGIPERFTGAVVELNFSKK